MRVVLAYCNKEEGLVTSLASWMREIGPYHDHTILVCRDRTTQIRPFANIGFGKYDEIEILDDAWRSWPQSCNNVFGHAARYIAYNNDEPFLWLEPDVVPFFMKDTNFVSAIEREYANCNRPFLGDYVSVHTKELDVPNHMSGVAVYPKDLINHAGPVFNAHTHAWDIAACKQIVPHMAVSKLIRHVWKHEPFNSLEDVQNNVFFHKPGCVLFHADKSGSLINLLRQQKAGVVPTTVSSPGGSLPCPPGVSRAAPANVDNLPAPVLAEPRPETTATKSGGEARESTQDGSPPPVPPETDSRGGQFICDIFIKSYPPDYERLRFCLRSIDLFCSGFRRIVLVVPHGTSPGTKENMLEIPVVEYGEGYMFQQAIKANAHEFTDAEYILHIDSDTMFTRPVTPDTFFVETYKHGLGDVTKSTFGQPVTEKKLLWLYTPYSEIETPWQAPTEKFFGGTLVEFEFMRRLPMMVPRWLHKDLARFCLLEHGMRLSDYIMSQPSRSFSEFNALGAFAWKFKQPHFSWLLTTKEPLPPEVALQRWSGAPFDEAQIAQSEAILSGGVNERAPTASNSEPPSDQGLQSPKSENNGTPELKQDSTPPSQAIIPWADRAESEKEIKRLCLALKAFQTAPVYTNRVRLELKCHHVVPSFSKVKAMKRRRSRLG